MKNIIISSEKMNRKKIMLTIIITLVYLILGILFQDFSFGNFQIRVADSLYPLIAILGLPCFIGTFLGHIIFNIYGFSANLALGMLDLLSPLLFLIPKYAIYKWKLKAVPIHVAFVAFWVAFLLFHILGLPYWESVITVGTGETISMIIIGIPLALILKKILKDKNLLTWIR